MKKYGKLTYKTFQIRLSVDENDELTKIIKRFKKTRREFILATMNDLKDYTVIRNNSFWLDNKDFAYSNSYIYNKNKPEVCELCGNKYIKENEHVLNAHHYLGYEGKNALKVKQLCRRCHGFCHRSENNRMPWELVLENYKKWDGKSRQEEIIRSNINIPKTIKEIEDKTN
jgi:hypothetical protein